jgi:hypothetical protein
VRTTQISPYPSNLHCITFLNVVSYPASSSSVTLLFLLSLLSCPSCHIVPLPCHLQAANTAAFVHLVSNRAIADADTTSAMRRMEAKMESMESVKECPCFSSYSSSHLPPSLFSILSLFLDRPNAFLLFIPHFLHDTLL